MPAFRLDKGSECITWLGSRVEKTSYELSVEQSQRGPVIGRYFNHTVLINEVRVTSPFCGCYLQRSTHRTMRMLMKGLESEECGNFEKVGVLCNACELSVWSLDVILLRDRVKVDRPSFEIWVVAEVQVTTLKATDSTEWTSTCLASRPCKASGKHAR